MKRYLYLLIILLIIINVSAQNDTNGSSVNNVSIVNNVTNETTVINESMLGINPDVLNNTAIQPPDNTNSIGDLNIHEDEHIINPPAEVEKEEEKLEVPQMDITMVVIGGLAIIVFVVVMMVVLIKNLSKKQSKEEKLEMLPDEREKAFDIIMKNLEDELK